MWAKLSVIIIALLSSVNVRSQEWIDVENIFAFSDFKSENDLKGANFYILGGYKTDHHVLTFDKTLAQLDLTYISMGGPILFIIEKNDTKMIMLLDHLSNIDRSKGGKGHIPLSAIFDRLMHGYFIVENRKFIKSDNEHLCSWLQNQTLINLEVIVK